MRGRGRDRRATIADHVAEDRNRHQDQRHEREETARPRIHGVSPSYRTRCRHLCESLTGLLDRPTPVPRALAGAGSGVGVGEGARAASLTGARTRGVPAASTPAVTGVLLDRGPVTPSHVFRAPRAHGSPHLDRRSTAQTEGDRGARKRDREARRSLCSRTASGTRRASEREATGEQRDAQQRHDKESATVHAHGLAVSVDPVPGDADGVHQDGHAIGLIPAGLRHVSTRTGSLP